MPTNDPFSTRQDPRMQDDPEDNVKWLPPGGSTVDKSQVGDADDIDIEYLRGTSPNVDRDTPKPSEDL